MESTGQGSARRRRFGITLAYERQAMDDEEFKQVYNQACDAAIGIMDEDAKRAYLLALQLIAGLQAQIEEMQLEADDC